MTNLHSRPVTLLDTNMTVSNVKFVLTISTAQCSHIIPIASLFSYQGRSQHKTPSVITSTPTASGFVPPQEVSLCIVFNSQFLWNNEGIDDFTLMFMSDCNDISDHNITTHWYKRANLTCTIIHVMLYFKNGHDNYVLYWLNVNMLLNMYSEYNISAPTIFVINILFSPLRCLHLDFDKSSDCGKAIQWGGYSAYNGIRIC